MTTEKGFLQTLSSVSVEKLEFVGCWMLVVRVYFVDFLVRLFHEKLRAYDFAFGLLSFGSSTQ